FFFQAEDGIRDRNVTGVQTCALPIWTAFELPQRILWELLDDFVLVSDEALKDATRLMIEKTRNLVEPAGAAALAAVLGTPERFADRKSVVVCSGGNISPAQLAALWPGEPA